MGLTESVIRVHRSSVIAYLASNWAFWEQMVPELGRYATTIIDPILEEKNGGFSRLVSQIYNDTNHSASIEKLLSSMIKLDQLWPYSMPGDSGKNSGVLSLLNGPMHTPDPDEWVDLSFRAVFRVACFVRIFEEYQQMTPDERMQYPQMHSGKIDTAPEYAVTNTIKIGGAENGFGLEWLFSCLVGRNDPRMASSGYVYLRNPLNNPLLLASFLSNLPASELALSCVGGGGFLRVPSGPFLRHAAKFFDGVAASRRVDAVAPASLLKSP